MIRNFYLVLIILLIGDPSIVFRGRSLNSICSSSGVGLLFAIALQDGHLGTEPDKDVKENSGSDNNSHSSDKSIDESGVDLNPENAIKSAKGNILSRLIKFVNGKPVNLGEESTAPDQLHIDSVESSNSTLLNTGNVQADELLDEERTIFIEGNNTASISRDLLAANDQPTSAPQISPASSRPTMFPIYSYTYPSYGGVNTIISNYTDPNKVKAELRKAKLEKYKDRMTRTVYSQVKTGQITEGNLNVEASNFTAPLEVISIDLSELFESIVDTEILMDTIVKNAAKARQRVGLSIETHAATLFAVNQFIFAQQASNHEKILQERFELNKDILPKIYLDELRNKSRKSTRRAQNTRKRVVVVAQQSQNQMSSTIATLANQRQSVLQNHKEIVLQLNQLDVKSTAPAGPMRRKSDVFEQVRLANVNMSLIEKSNIAKYLDTVVSMDTSKDALVKRLASIRHTPGKKEGPVMAKFRQAMDSGVNAYPPHQAHNLFQNPAGEVSELSKVTQGRHEREKEILNQGNFTSYDAHLRDSLTEMRAVADNIVGVAEKQLLAFLKK